MRASKAGRALAALLLTTAMLAPGVATGFPQLQPGAPEEHAIIDALLRGDGLALARALAQDEGVAELLAEPMPPDVVVLLLRAHTPAEVAQAMRELRVAALRDVVAPEWLDEDGARVVQFLLANYDPALQAFTFHTDYPVLDNLVARLLLASLAASEVDRFAREGGLEAQFRSLLETGELPPGWTIEDVEPVHEPAPDGDDEPQAQAAEDLSQVPEDAAPRGVPAGPGVAAEDRSRTFFIDDCGLCGQSMGAYNSPLTATFDLADLSIDLIEEGALAIRTYDVDWFVAIPCGSPIEKDDVYLNGRYVGHLTGANEQWSTSTFALDPEWFVEGTNTILLYVDTMGNGCWRATTSWLQVDVNAQTGDVIVDQVDTDKQGYNLGDAVQATATVHTDADEEYLPYPASLTFNLHNPDGDIPDQGTQSITLPDNAPQDFDKTLNIPRTQQVGTADVGVWTVSVIAYDKDGKLSDKGSHQINVGTDLSIVKDDVEVEKVSTNPTSKATNVKVSGTFHYATALDTAQSATLAIYVLQKGSVVRTAEQPINLPAGPTSGELTIDPVTVTLDTRNKPAIKLVVDSKGAINEVSEENNEVLIDKFGKPELTKVESRLKGNFLQNTALDDPNDYTSVTEDPEIGEPVEKVKYTIKNSGGGTVASGESSDRPGKWKWSHDVGTYAKGQYKIEAIAVTGDGIESDPANYEWWNFGNPNFLTALENFGDLWDLGSPQDRGTWERYWGKAKVSISIDLLDAAFGSFSKIIKKVLVELLSTRLCLNSGTIKIGFSADWSHEVASDKSTWKAGINIKASLDVFGKAANLGGGGSLTWTFSAGDWHISAGSATATAGFSWSCNAINAIISLLDAVAPSVGTALAKFNEKFGVAELLLSFGPQFTLGLTFDETSRKLFDLLPLKDASLAAQAVASAQASIGYKSNVRLGVTVTGDFVFRVGYIAASHDWSLAQLGFCSSGCSLEAWAKVKFWWISAEKTFVSVKVFDRGELIWPKLSAADAAAAPEAGLPVLRVARTPWAQPVPAAFVGGAGGLLVSGAPELRATATLASDGEGDVLVLYDTDNLAQTITGSPDIAGAALDERGWRDLGVVVSSDRIDAVPRVALAPDGSGVAVWERITDLLQPSDNPMDHLASSKVFYAARDSYGEWSAPRAVAPGEPGMQYAAKVALSPDGLVAAVSWLQDRDGDLDTDDRAPMVASVLNGAPGPAAALDAPASYADAPFVAPLPGGVAAAAFVPLGERGARSLVLRTGDLLTGTWTKPVPLALEEEGPDAPRILADVGGLTVAWTERVGESLRLVERTSLTLPPQLKGITASDLALGPKREVLPADPAATHHFSDLELLGDGAGMRFFVWQDPGARKVRMLAEEPRALEPTAEDADRPLPPPSDLLDDPLATLPQMPERLTQRLRADALHGRAHPIVDLLEGDFHGFDAAYRPGADSVMVVATRVAEGQPSDVVVGEHALGGDLEVSSLKTIPKNPAPGKVATIRVELANVGHRPSQANLLAVTSNSAVLRVAPVPPLAVGESATVDINWTVPAMARANELVARLDAFGITPDADASNDEATLRVTMPDLAPRFLDAAAVGKKVELIASVQNVGTLRSEPGTVEFAVPGGTRLGTVAVPALGPRDSAAASILVDPSQVQEGLNTVAATVRSPLDFDAANDAEELVAVVLPDLALVDAALGDVVRGQPASLVAKVANEGVFASGPSELVAVMDGSQEVARVPVPALAPGESVRLHASFAAPEGLHDIRVSVNPLGTAKDDKVSNNDAYLRFEPAPAALATLNAASVVYTPTGMLVRVRNAGDGLLTLADFAVYRGAPQDRPRFGNEYVTRVPNLFGVAGIGGVVGQGTGSVLVPDDRLVIRVTSPDRPNTQTRLRDLAADETVSVRLDPFGTSLDQAQPYMVVAKPLVSIDSPTHPDPLRATLADSPSFTFGVVPGRTAAGFSYVLDSSPTTVPDTVVDTAASAVGFSGLAPGSYWLHARAQFTTGAWTSTDHFPIRIAPQDTQPPTTLLVPGEPALVQGPASYTVTTATRIELVATDDVSGVAATYHRVDGGAAVTGSVLTLAVGAHSLTYWSVDAAGNAEAPRTASFTVESTLDRQAPETLVTPSRSVIGTAGGVVVRRDTTFRLDASDPFEHILAPPSGVGAIKYNLDGGPDLAYAGPFAAPQAEGAHALTYWAVDLAGNAEARHTLAFEVDASVPRGALVEPGHDSVVVGGRTTFVVEAADAVAGVGEVELYHEGKSLGKAGTDGQRWFLTTDTSQWPLGNNVVVAQVRDALGHAMETSGRYYVVARDASLQHDPPANAQQLLPHPALAVGP